MATIVNFRVVEIDRAAFFITEYDIDHLTYTPVDIDNLIIEDVRRFYTALLINVLESDNRLQAIEDLEERLGMNSGGTTGTGIAGHVSIVDVTANGVGNVGGKVLSQDNHRLESCTSDTTNVTVHVLAITGPSNYKPNITLNGIPVTLSEESDAPLWSGAVNITVPVDGLLIAEHEDGATDAAVVNVESAPTVTSAIFINGYPLGQTELKQGDTFQLSVVADKTITRIDVINTGACQTYSVSFPATTTKNIMVTIADRGNTATLRGATIRVYDEYGSVSANFSTSSQGTIDGTHVVLCNNQHPVLNFGGIDYPPTQQALKNTETADVAFTYSSVDTVSFTSPNGQLSITNSTLLETVKTVTRIGGSYNISSSNLRATGNRAANNATTTVSEVVYIANSSPSITVSNATRLRSGGNQGTSVQNHVVTISSNQRLIGTPSLDNTLGAGTFIGSWVGGPTSFLRTMQVHDDNPKGTFSYLNLSTTNLAGIAVNTLSGGSSYVLGGFVSRDLYFPVIQNEVSIGTVVSNTGKLVTLDKDLISMTYQSSLANGSRRYTITGPSGIVNSNGYILYWADETEVDNNTTGGAFIRIEEVI